MRAIIKILIFPLIALLEGASFSHAQIYPLGFTDAEIKKVHSDLFEDDGKVLWPISKEAINKVISWNQADRETKIAFGDFKFLGDSKGYIHLGQEVDQYSYDQLVSVLSDLNSYTELRMGGKPLFQDIVAVDQNGRPQTSVFVSRNLIYSGTMYAQVLVSTQGINLKADLQFNILETSDGLALELFNIRPVRYGLLGQIFGSGDFYLRVDFVPFDRGWLFRGITRFNPSPFLASMIKDPSSLAYGGQMLQWLEPFIVEPLPK